MTFPRQVSTLSRPSLMDPKLQGKAESAFYARRTGVIIQMLRAWGPLTTQEQ